MSRLKNCVVTTLGFSVLIIAILVALPSAMNAVPTDRDVRVINSTMEPVPTAAQGTTTIAGTVSLAAGSSVSVANTMASAVPIVNSNDARQPFQKTAVGTQNGTNASTLTIATVPAGKRLVIEFISVSGQVPPGQHVEFFHLDTVAGPFGAASHDLLVNAQPDAVIGDALFRASQQVRVYADTGTQVSVMVRRNSNAGSASYGATISGYLVDL